MSRTGKIGGRYPHIMLYCDESYIAGKEKYFGWGSLWSPKSRSGDFPEDIRQIREKHGIKDEIKWNKVTDANLAFYLDLVDYFFAQKTLMFHALVIPRHVVKWSLYPHKQAAKVYFLSVLLAAKLREYALPSTGRKFSIIVDPLPVSYLKEHEKIEKIRNAVLRQELQLDEGPIESVNVAADSRTSPGIQLCDLLLGAVMWARNNGHGEGNRATARAAIADRVAHHMQWADAAGSTVRQAWKFNIWVFLPKGMKRVEEAREVPRAFRDIEYWRTEQDRRRKAS